MLMQFPVFGFFSRNHFLEGRFIMRGERASTFLENIHGVGNS